MTREMFVRKDFIKVLSLSGTDIYMKTDLTKSAPYMAMGFSGKKAKYDFFFSFRTMEDRANYVNKFENRIKAWKKRIQENKDARRAPTKLTEGSILYTSWGYDQTNIDFYQVTKVIGKKMVELRELVQSRDTSGMAFDQGMCSPIKDKFTDEAPIRKIASSDSVKIKSYAIASLWDGRPKHFTSYA